MSPSGRRLPGWALPAVLVVLVVGLVALALSREPVSLDPDSPEGTVQEYLLAISEERFEDAISVIHDEWRGTCEPTDLEAVADTDFTAELGSQTGFGAARFGSAEGGMPVPDHATDVRVTITQEDAGGFGGGWSEVVDFQLIDDGGFWWLVGDPWPHFAWSCQGIP
jgi:hypothetical protein